MKKKLNPNFPKQKNADSILYQYENAKRKPKVKNIKRKRFK